MKSPESFKMVDFICYNIYPVNIFDRNGQIASIKDLDKCHKRIDQIIKTLQKWCPDKPIVVSEFGCEAVRGIHGEQYLSEELQKALISDQVSRFSRHKNVIGWIIWAYSDYEYGAHFCPPESNLLQKAAWGLVDMERNEKQAFRALPAILRDGV